MDVPTTTQNADTTAPSSPVEVLAPEGEVHHPTSPTGQPGWAGGKALEEKPLLAPKWHTCPLVSK